MKVNMKEVMQNAVRMAKKMEGHWVARMKMALKTAWSLARVAVKKDLKEWVKEIKEAFLEEMITVQANTWEKYGKRRIYINGGYGLDAGYFDFDDNGNYIKAWSEYSDWDNGRTSSQFKVIRNLLEKGVW